MESAVAHNISPMLAATIAAVKKVAREEVMPRYLKVAHERKTR